MNDDEEISKEELLNRLEQARNDYVFPGMNGKKPLRSTMALAKKYQIDHLIVARHAPVWLAEVRANNRTLSSVYSKAIETETIESYEDDIAWMREQIDKLQGVIRDMAPEAIGGDSYEFITKQILKLQVRWSQLSGVADAIRVAALARLTAIREEVKQQFVKELPPPEEDPVKDAKAVEHLKIFDMGQGEKVAG